jgi:hypothetical protein
MSKGPSQVGTQTTTQTNPTAEAQRPYLEQGWSEAQRLYNNAAPVPYPNNTWVNPDPTGYNAMMGVGANTLPGVAGAAAQPFYAGTGGAYSVGNSPAYAGFQQQAQGSTPGQQQAAYGAQQIGGLAPQAAGIGQYYGGQIGNVAAGIPGSVADPLAYMRNTASGAYLNANPYIDPMIAAGQADITRAYQTATAPRTGSSYEQAGRYGSPSMQNAVSQQQRDLGTTLGNWESQVRGAQYAREREAQETAARSLGSLSLDAQRAQMQGWGQAGQSWLAGLQGAGSLYNTGGSLGLSGTEAQRMALQQLQGGYQTGNAQAMQAAGLAPQIQQGYLAGPSAQVTAGAGLTQQQQAILDASVRQWYQIQQQPWSNLSQYQQLIGAPVTGSGTSSQPIYGSGPAQTIGALGSLGSAAASIIPLLSDRRLKEDTRVVGHLGRLPLHEFKYKGDPTRRIGFMADEVAQIDPGAVVETSIGFAAVNYGRAAASALKGAGG